MSARTRDFPNPAQMIHFGRFQKQRAPKRPLDYETRRSALLGAGLAVVGVIALCLGVGFCQVFANLGFSVEFGALAMVGLGFRIDPYLPISTA